MAAFANSRQQLIGVSVFTGCIFDLCFNVNVITVLCTQSFRFISVRETIGGEIARYLFTFNMVKVCLVIYRTTRDRERSLGSSSGIWVKVSMIAIEGMQRKV